MNTANSLRKFSTSIGGARQVYTEALNILVGGFGIAAANLPASGNVLPAGTPILVYEITRLSTVHYAFEVVEDVDATHIKVKKGIEGVRAKVGMVLMKAPATVATTGQGYTITEIDSSNDSYDVLTMSGDLSEAEGDILVEAIAEAEDTTVKVIPNALSVADIYIDPTAYDFSVAAGFGSKGMVYGRRISPICPAVKTALRDNECYFRFSTSK